MLQLVMTVTIGDGRIVATEFDRAMENCATPRDKLEARQLEMILKARVQRFARRKSREEDEDGNC